MIGITDTAPDVAVQVDEYVRLLGYPRGWVLGDRARELADWAREWYARNGRPWVYARQADAVHTQDDGVVIDGVAFSSSRLRHTFRAAEVHGAVLVAASAGPELELEAQARWRDEKPDEYFFLEMYGSAVVEHLVTVTGARLCAWADGEGSAVLPHYSPGYPEWTIEEQPQLLDLIARGRRDAIPLDLLDSGMLRPKKSLLAVFGVTRHTDRVRRLSELSPCENCSFAPCVYRRAPYRRTQPAAGPPAPLDTDATYTVSRKALQRWSDDRLTIATGPDGSVEALFRYEGTTCTNTGRPLHFHYRVVLGPADEGHPIREQWCGPAPGDDGHLLMCGYLTQGTQLMAAIETERPLHGQPLDAVIHWTRPTSPAGCYCETDSRQHKWGLVLETIHYALTRQTISGSPAREKAEQS